MKHKNLILAGLFVMFSLIVTGCGGETAAPAEEAQAPAPGFTPAQVCNVPDVVGLDQAVAEDMLAGLGLQPDKSVQHDASVAEGAVISQDPPAGTRMEPCQGDVTIVISLGPMLEPSPTPVPTDTPAPPTPTSTPIPTPTPFSGPIPFASLDNPQMLNPVLGWQPGGSQANAYDLTMYPDALTLIAGTETDQWKEKDSAPLVVYPIQGNFEAQVKVVFDPVQDFQLAGIGLRSAHMHNTWLRIARGVDRNAQGQCIYVTGDQQGRELRLSSTLYTDNTVWFKFERRGSLFDLSYSTNGSNWVTLEKDYVFEVSTDTEIFLFAYSTPSDKGVVAQFYDFAVLRE